MYIDVLVAEIGSTTTAVNAFHGVMSTTPAFVGQGQAATTVDDGDVRIGLSAAIEDLRRKRHTDRINYGEMLATSSAAGGLRMTVHGLVWEMTARAGREAALGAGANIRLTTAGKLRDSDLAAVRSIAPNLMLLAGGTDYGEHDTALYNAQRLCELEPCAPVIYAGNIQCRDEISTLFKARGIPLYITENVYPRLDELNIEPVRRLIHSAFEAHITQAAGMAHIRELVTGTILPTPGAVMACARLLYEEIGDLMVVDVGGATTDVHSVTDGAEEITRMQTAPEPKAKRTVEGDLGVYVSANTLAETVGLERLSVETGMDVAAVLRDYAPIPESELQLRLATALAGHAAAIAIQRHAGRMRYTFNASGRRTWAEGKDLTQLRWLVATGGALTRLPERGAVLRGLCDLNTNGAMLYPKPGQMQILEDRRYIMASLGVLSERYPEAATALLRADIAP